MEDDSFSEGSDLGMDDMTKIETFWGKTLSSKNRVYDWTGELEAEEGIRSTVELRGACLGVSDSLKPKDRNVVAITVENEDGEDETFVIASLRLEGTEQVSLLHHIEAPAKFELLQGPGPVHITGVMMSEFAMHEEEDDEDEEEEEEEEQQVQSSKPVNKVPQLAANNKGTNNKPSILKRPAETSSQPKPAKVRKVEPEEEEEDEEVDESMEGNGDASMEDNELESGDEEEESEEDNDDEDEDDEEEEEEEEEVPPPKKKVQAKSGQVKKPAVVSRTPQPVKTNKPPVKAPLSAQKAGKATTPNKAPLSVDQIKKKLIQTGNFPKKLDKFNNYMTNTFKVTDDNAKKELWEFAQKNRK